MEPALAFHHERVRSELVVASVYVRIFNRDPSQPLLDAATFLCGALASVASLATAYLAHRGLRLPCASPSPQQLQGASALGAGENGTAWSDGGVGEGTGFTERDAESLLMCTEAAEHVMEQSGALSVLAADSARLAGVLSLLLPALAAGVPASAHSIGDLDAELCRRALRLLLLITSQGRGLDALSSEDTATRLFWIVGAPPDAAARGLALRVLQALSGRPHVGYSAAKQGGALFLLHAMCPASDASYTGGAGGVGDSVEVAMRGAAAALLGRLMQGAAHGPLVCGVVGSVLPRGIVDAIRDGPGESAVAALEEASGEWEVRVSGGGWTSAGRWGWGGQHVGDVMD